MRFGKWGRGLLREGKRREGEWAVWAKGGGKNINYLNIINTKCVGLEAANTYPIKTRS